MVVAPAGTGKTVLLADWAARCEEPIRWISAAGAPATLDELLPADDADLVVIDDAHLLPAGALEQLSELLSDSSSNVRLLMASRYDLPVPIFELELRGLGSTLRARDLQFRDTEAADLVRAHAAGASQAEVDQLQEKAAGWAAALVLGARAIAASGDGQAPVLTERPVLDLLLGESFNTLDERTQDVLVCTFGEPDVTARLATVLSGDKDAGALLADLAASGLLVTAYGDEPRSEEPRGGKEGLRPWRTWWVAEQ
jgi:ATP/maltotriose-dependent transcriptional regulator MalT